MCNNKTLPKICQTRDRCNGRRTDEEILIRPIASRLSRAHRPITAIYLRFVCEIMTTRSPLSMCFETCGLKCANQQPDNAIEIVVYKIKDKTLNVICLPRDVNGPYGFHAAWENAKNWLFSNFIIPYFVQYVKMSYVFVLCFITILFVLYVLSGVKILLIPRFASNFRIHYNY